MIKWNNIKTVEQWSGKLGELLEAAREAALKKDLEPRLTVNKSLMEFVEHSFPNSPEIQALDDIAIETASNLMRQTIEDRLQSISDRTGEYQKLNKQLGEITTAATEKAESIRLQSITSFIDCTTKTIDTAKDLLKSIGAEAEDKDIREKLETMVKSLETLRSSLGKKL